MEAMNDDKAVLEEFGKRWAEAEVAQDVTVLDSPAHKDFILVGPLGFILDKPSGSTATATVIW
jgi:hypothetical protein